MKDSYSKLSSIYDTWAALCSFDAIHRVQLQAIGAVDLPVREILVVGGGTGRILPALIGSFSEARILYVDAAYGMVSKAKRRLRHLTSKDRSRVNFLCADIRKVELSGQFELIITPFFLDQFSEREVLKILALVDRVAAREMRWVDVDFRIPQRDEWGYRFLLFTLYKTFRVLCRIEAEELPNIPKLFTSRGLQLKRQGFASFRCLQWSVYSRIPV